MDGLSVGGATIPQPLSGVLAAIRNKSGATVTRKEAKSSMRLRKNGVLPYQAAVWCAETVGDRVRVTRPCAGWLDKSDIVEGQIVVVSAAGGATCRKDLELDSEVVAELATDSRVFVTEQDETRDGKLRAKVFSPVEGWVSVKCLAPICDRSGNLLAAGKAILEPSDVNDKQVHYSHYVEINHEAMYKALWDSGLRLCGTQRKVDGVESARHRADAATETRRVTQASSTARASASARRPTARTRTPSASWGPCRARPSAGSSTRRSRTRCSTSRPSRRSRPTAAGPGCPTTRRTASSRASRTRFFLLSPPL